MFDKKKKGPMLSDNERNAKMSVLKDLRNQASQSMGNRLKDMKKVTVSAPDEQGIKAGLEKAKELIAGKHGEPMEGSPEEEGSESPLEEELEEAHGDISPDEDDVPGTPEEIDEKIKELLALKDRLLEKKDSPFPA